MASLIGNVFVGAHPISGKYHFSTMRCRRQGHPPPLALSGNQHIEEGNKSYLNTLDVIDQYIDYNGLELPEYPDARNQLPPTEYEKNAILESCQGSYHLNHTGSRIQA